jgi:hypothetical protein
LNEFGFTYAVFGLTLRSNLLIAELPLAQKPDVGPDVDIHLSVSPLGTRIVTTDPEVITYVSPYRDGAG